jgi:voltage-gated potassium channel
VGRLNVLERRLARFLSEPASVRAAVGVIVTATVLVVVGAGVLISILDRDEYPTVWLGMWVALQTVTTVGYGDVAPVRVGGRIVAAVVMLYGVAFVAIVTAAITSTFVARATEQHEAAQRQASEYELIERRFDELERKLDALAAGRPPAAS